MHSPCVVTGSKLSSWVTVYWNTSANNQQSIVTVVEVNLQVWVNET